MNQADYVFELLNQEARHRWPNAEWLFHRPVDSVFTFVVIRCLVQDRAPADYELDLASWIVLADDPRALARKVLEVMGYLYRLLVPPTVPFRIGLRNPKRGAITR